VGQEMVDSNFLEARVMCIGVAEEGIDFGGRGKLLAIVQCLDCSFYEGFTETGKEEYVADRRCMAGGLAPRVAFLEKDIPILGDGKLSLSDAISHHESLHKRVSLG